MLPELLTYDPIQKTYPPRVLQDRRWVRRDHVARCLFACSACAFADYRTRSTNDAARSRKAHRCSPRSAYRGLGDSRGGGTQ
jgi:hypothetical protein